jgi:hypothetical protein
VSVSLSIPGPAEAVAVREGVRVESERPVSLVSSMVGVSARTATSPLRATLVLVYTGRALERRTRTALKAAGGQMALDALEAVLSSDAIDRALERIEAAGVGEKVARRMLEDGLAEQIVTGALEGPELERIFSSALVSDRIQDDLARALESEGVERLLDRLLNSPASERLLSQVLRSPLLEETVTRLLESEELWVLVDEIARSPSVTEAITHQSAGFIDQVTDKVRDRSREGDALMERAARRFSRRRKTQTPNSRKALDAGETPPPDALPDTKPT